MDRGPAPGPGISFAAALAPVAGAVAKHGQGGFRIVLEVPDSEAEAMKQLLEWDARLLRVAIIPQPK